MFIDQILPKVFLFLSTDNKEIQGDQLCCRCLRCLLEDSTGGLNGCTYSKISLFNPNLLQGFMRRLAPALLRNKERWPFPTSLFKPHHHSLTTGKTKPVTTNKACFASSWDINCFCAQENVIYSIICLFLGSLDNVKNTIPSQFLTRVD